MSSSVNAPSVSSFDISDTPLLDHSVCKLEAVRRRPGKVPPRKVGRAQVERWSWHDHGYAYEKLARIRVQVNQCHLPPLLHVIQVASVRNQ